MMCVAFTPLGLVPGSKNSFGTRAILRDSNKTSYRFMNSGGGFGGRAGIVGVPLFPGPMAQALGDIYVAPSGSRLAILTAPLQRVASRHPPRRAPIRRGSISKRQDVKELFRRQRRWLK